MNDKKYKKVVLFSGGVNSVCLAAKYPDAALLYIDTGNLESPVEKLAAYDIARMLGRSASFYMEMAPYIGKWRKQGGYTPNKNFFLVGVGSFYAKVVLIGIGLENKLDNRPRIGFCESVTSAISFDSNNVFISAKAPFINKSKVDIVKDYICNGGSEEILKASMSCHNRSGRCGNCNPCLDRWMALKNNGIEP
jgi:7-cyano-7-deazaguanine synthase in queuosine biosynthesis